MKTIRTSILTIALATFAFAIMTPEAQAIPRGKVPGAYVDGKFHNPGYSDSTQCGEKLERKCSDRTVCDSCKRKQKSNRKDDRKPYWKKKIGI